jgi:monofunctional biosynthetic peptidoglycan transglycosylase
MRRKPLKILLAVAALCAVVWFLFIPFPWTLWFRNPGRTELMNQRIREARAEDESFEVQQEWVPLEEISDRLERAVITAEDGRFRDHGGIDWLALASEVDWEGDEEFSWWSREDRRALWAAFRHVRENSDELRGRSTITQQLAKNLYFGTDRTLFRKGIEVIVTKRLEWVLGKDRILELYLNLVEFGPGIFGAEAASQHYFGTSAANLTLWQAATLAAVLPHPLTSNPDRSPGQMAWRRDIIFARLQGPPPETPLDPIPQAPEPLAPLVGEVTADSTVQPGPEEGEGDGDQEEGVSRAEEGVEGAGAGAGEGPPNPEEGAAPPVPEL